MSFLIYITNYKILITKLIPNDFIFYSRYGGLAAKFGS